MALIEQLKQERDDLLAHQDVLSRKISELRRESAIEAAANVKFQLKEQIKVATQEREQVEAQIDELGEKIAAADRRPGGGLVQGVVGAQGGRGRPQSNAYGNAHQRIDEALMQPPLRRVGKMGEIERSLQRAAHDEGGDQTPEHVRCYLRFEQARVHYLRGQYDEARNLFEQVRDHLIDTDDDDPLLREAREFLAVIELQADIADLTDRGRRGLVVRVQRIITFFLPMRDLARSPAACMLYHELSQIAQAQENPVAAEILGSRMADYQGAVRSVDEQQLRDQKQLAREDLAFEPERSTAQRDKRGER